MDLRAGIGFDVFHHFLLPFGWDVGILLHRVAPPRLV
jgi:hypothetical protein